MAMGVVMRAVCLLASLFSFCEKWLIAAVLEMQYFFLFVTHKIEEGKICWAALASTQIALPFPQETKRDQSVSKYFTAKF